MEPEFRHAGQVFPNFLHWGIDNWGCLYEYSSVQVLWNFWQSRLKVFWRGDIMIRKGQQIYEGKAKIVFEHKDDPTLVIQHFKDDATAFDGVKKGKIGNKGIINNSISSRLFKLLEDNGIATHFVDKISERDMLVRRVKIILVELIVRNVTAGSLSKRTGWEEGIALKQPVVEMYYKNDALHDPMINDDHVAMLELATPEELEHVRKTARKINELLTKFLGDRNLVLVDIKLEFGRTEDGTVLLADEISPDTCRYWDKETGERLDKDRFRRDLGRVEESYEEVYRRIFIEG